MATDTRSSICTIMTDVVDDGEASHILQILPGAHIRFCNLDELMTSLLGFLHYIVEQFRTTCDKISYLVPHNHFRLMRQNVR